MTLEETLQWIANIFEEPVENIKSDTPRDEIVAWDSLGILTLMAGLNEEFDITMTETEIQDMKSVQDILDLFKGKGKLD